MSDSQQTNTAAKKTKAQKKNNPAAASSQQTSVTSTLTQQHADHEPQSRSQSQRRRKQNRRSGQIQRQESNVSADTMFKVDERDENQPPEDEWLNNPAVQDVTEVQPFERIKPPSQSMDGPVTYARMMRGEIPMRGAPPKQPISTTQGVDAKSRGSDMMEQDGLKLRIELNLDIELELKASIHGDLTLALLA